MKRQEEAARKAHEAAEIELQKQPEHCDLSKYPPINVQELSLTDAIYLLSILVAEHMKTLPKIIPVSLFEQPLSADNDFSTEIINHLYENGLIYAHPDTEPEGFKKDEVSTFYIYRVYYAPPVSQTAPDDPASCNRIAQFDKRRMVGGLVSGSLQYLEEGSVIQMQRVFAICFE